MTGDKTYEVERNGDRVQLRVLQELDDGSKVVTFLDNIQPSAANAIAFDLTSNARKITDAKEKST